jgi:Carboxypeptidase regulatory-like domain
VQSLPDAPSFEQKEAASVSGTIIDSSGAVVAGAAVSLLRNGEAQVTSVPSGADGGFTFGNLSPGSFVITVTTNGFQQANSANVALTENQTYHVPNIVLAVAGTSTEVVVRPTEVIAAQQMKAEEKQRLLGIVPDFYVSYVWDAAPLNTKQKFSMELRDIFDPTTFIGVSIGAGIQQARNTFPGFGQGAAGYGKRWGALFANGRTSDFLSRAVFASMFHQDPRYFYQGSSGSTWSRTKHAVGYAFVARSDSGHVMPNYSYFLGTVCAGALSNVYYPDSSRGAGLVFENAALGFAGRSAQNLAHEFLFKHLTKHVPGKGKPSNGTGNP